MPITRHARTAGAHAIDHEIRAVRQQRMPGLSGQVGLDRRDAVGPQRRRLRRIAGQRRHGQPAPPRLPHQLTADVTTTKYNQAFS